MSAENNEEAFEGFREHLRQNSEMSEDEVSRAVNLARDYLKRSSQ